MAIFTSLSDAPLAADSLEHGTSFSIIDAVKQVGEADIDNIIRYLGEGALQLLGNILASILIYYIGRWILRRVISIVDVAFDKRGVDVSVRSFVRSLVKVLVYLVIILVIVQILGINTTSLVAMLASAGLAVGMALSGTLQNFAGGVMILFLKPYRVGDYITAQGESGIVKDIMLFTTVLETYDRHTIFVPNSSISSSIIDNATFSKVRRIDWSVGLSYGTSIDEARKVILEILAEDKRILNTEANPSVVQVSALADSSVNIVVRGWTVTEDYWDVYFDGYEKIYTTLPERGIHFPFPQLDVHLKKE